MCQYVSAPLGWNMVNMVEPFKNFQSFRCLALVTLTAAQGVHGYSLALALWSCSRWSEHHHGIPDWCILLQRWGDNLLSPQNSCVGYIIPRVQVKLAKTISLFTGQNYPSAHPSRSRGHLWTQLHWKSGKVWSAAIGSIFCFNCLNGTLQEK